MRKRLDSNNRIWGLLPVVLSLAWPTMLEQLMQTGVQYIDTAMVGTLGTDATAAVGATTTLNWLFGSTLYALGVGFLAFVSQACGAGDQARARRAAGQAVLAVLISGVFFTVLSLSLSGVIPAWMQVEQRLHKLTSQYFFVLYAPMLARTAMIIFGMLLRAVGDTKTPMRIGVLVNIINIILNFLLIYPTRHVRVLGMELLLPGAGMGVTGAALASAIAYTVGGICITAALWKHKDISPKGQPIRPDWKILRPCMRIAIPNALQRFGTSLGYVAFAAMINALGEVSTAAHTVANTVESLFYIPGYGMQTAAATLTGNALGAGDNKRLRDISRMMLVLEVLLMLLSGGLLYVFAPAMVQLFSYDMQVILLGTTILRMVALSEPFFGISIVLEGMMMGMGKTLFPFVCNIIGMWGIRIVGTFICTQMFGMGLESAWGCMILHNLFLCITFYIYYASGKWNSMHDDEARLES